MRARLAKTLPLLLAPLLAVGCSDLGAPLKLVPRAQVSDSALDFGTVAVSASSTRSLTIGNTGEAALSGVASLSCADFSLESGGGAFSVPPAGAHVVVVRYEPTAVGGSSCELSLGDGLPPVALSGQGALQAPGARCVLSVAALDFGAITLGGSKLAAFTIRNPGTEATLLDVLPDCSAFSVVSGGGPSTLAPGDSLVVTLNFAPQAAGHTACNIAIGPGCPPLPVSGDATTVSFAAQIKPILSNRSCTSCHGWTRADQIVGIVSATWAPAEYIKPGDLSQSVIYGKITNSRQYGALMPPGGPLIPLAERDLFRVWILEGAHDN